MEAVKMNPFKLVMLVDDSSIDNFVNQKMIERNNFSKNIVTYKKAKKALEYLYELDLIKAPKDEIPSIIFLDLNMPEINGFDFIEKFEGFSEHITSNCKIVILTNSIDPTNLSSSNKHVITFLNKPIHKYNFERINFLLEKKLNLKMSISDLIKEN